MFVEDVRVLLLVKVYSLSINNDMHNKTLPALELQMNLNFIGKNTFKGIHYILGFLQILNLIMKLIIVLYESKQLVFNSKILYLMVNL